MRVKTSVTLPADLIARLDLIDSNRSAVLERAARAFLALQERQSRDTRDMEIIGRNADALNREAADALAFQRLK
jgi:metal-responsive CopG/Arc/MetJ family transcriptional regulator